MCLRQLKMPKVYLAADHAGFALKHALIEELRTLGYETEDLGAHTLSPEDDYPDFITPCAEKVASDEGSFGVVIGGSGQGEAMCANRVKGARAAVFYGPRKAVGELEREGSASIDEFDIVRLARAHNDANILSIGSRFVSHEEAVEALELFLSTPFSGSERHVRRIAKY